MFLIFPFSFFLSIFPPSASAQRIAILTLDKTEASRDFAEKLGEQLARNTTILDFSLAESAYHAVSSATPFNLTTEESKRLGEAIGCDFFILIRSATLRRSSFQVAEYYESYASIFLVSSRSGRLVLWNLPKFDASKRSAAGKMLSDSVEQIAAKIIESARTAKSEEIGARDEVFIEEVPEGNSPEAKNFRSPVPFRRIKPEYTAEAAFYDVAATVDIVVDLDASGRILRTRIVRWAGYGLDESVEKTVRAMNWLPATRNGKSLPIRFLLRYNFKKMEKE